MDEWWKTFFDEDYLRIWTQVITDETSEQQALDLWSMLDLSSGCRILDAPCGWGRLSLPLARLGATVLGVDQSDRQLAFAAHHLEELPPDRLRYLQHDLRTPLAETGFDVACNIFTSFGYGTEEEDIALFRTLRAAVRTGGRVDESNFDAISGVAQLNWYWSGPAGSGEKHAQWRRYTPTQIVDLLRTTGLRFDGAYRGLSKTPYKAEGLAAGGQLAVVAVRQD